MDKKCSLLLFESPCFQKFVASRCFHLWFVLVKVEGTNLLLIESNLNPVGHWLLFFFPRVQSFVFYLVGPYGLDSLPLYEAMNIVCFMLDP